MLFEYAVEPELVATWVEPRTGRYFIERFGIGSPRLNLAISQALEEACLGRLAGGGDEGRP